MSLKSVIDALRPYQKILIAFSGGLDSSVLLHRLAQPTFGQLDELRGLEDRICDEVAFHLKRCDRGGDDVELTAQTLVHAIDAQLHRVMTRTGFDPWEVVAALMVTVDRLAPG